MFNLNLPVRLSLNLVAVSTVFKTADIDKIDFLYFNFAVQRTADTLTEFKFSQTIIRLTNQKIFSIFMLII